jgi:putative cell wall-binding protein
MINRWTGPLAAGLLAAAVLGLAAPAGATSGVTASRLAGSNRYGTAEAIAQASFPQGAPSALLASGTAFPDALAGAYLAGRLKAPILLTDPAQLSAEAASALSALGAQTVDVVGGPAAVSANVVSQLQADGYRVARIYGSDRYATAATVAESYPSSTVGSLGGSPTAIVATGLAFPDALSGSPASYAAAFPVLLTDPSNLSAPTQSALGTLGIKQVLLLGGTAAVSANVANQISQMGITVSRIGGADRTQTATMVADLELGQLGFSASHVNLARGDDFADALSGAPHAGAETAPIVLTENPDGLGGYTTGWLQAHRATVSSIHVFGGPAAVADATVSAARQAAT